MPRGYADPPEDERLHHTITRTHERFDLWRFIYIIIKTIYYDGIFVLFFFVTNEGNTHFSLVECTIG